MLVTPELMEMEDTLLALFPWPAEHRPAVWDEEDLLVLSNRAIRLGEEAGVITEAEATDLYRSAREQWGS